MRKNILKVILIFSLFCLLLVLLHTACSNRDIPETIVIIYTTNTDAELEPCG